MKYRWLWLSAILLIYSGVSPVFVNTEYGISEQVSPNEDKTFYSIGMRAENNFKYYWLYSKSNYSLNMNSFYFFISDSSKEIDKFELSNLTATIDGKDYDIKRFSNQILPLDRSVTNGYAGRVGVLKYNLTLPDIPDELITLEVTGYAYDDDGDRKIVSVQVPCTIYKKEYIKPLYKYISGMLGT